MPNALGRAAVQRSDSGLRSLLSLLLRFLLLLVWIVEADEVKCFCDRLSCPGSLMCTGKWCLIGIGGEGGNGRLDQLCGWDERERPVDCAKNWDKWAEVCACDEPLCNTFAYLRSNMDQQQPLPMYDDPNSFQRFHHYGSGKFTSASGSAPKSRGWYQGGNLIVLLVILPLVVGGMAVCLVFVNYHCKMS